MHLSMLYSTTPCMVYSGGKWGFDKLKCQLSQYTAIPYNQIPSQKVGDYWELICTMLLHEYWYTSHTCAACSCSIFTNLTIITPSHPFQGLVPSWHQWTVRELIPHSLLLWSQISLWLTPSPFASQHGACYQQHVTVHLPYIASQKIPGRQFACFSDLPPSCRSGTSVMLSSKVNDPVAHGSTR